MTRKNNCNIDLVVFLCGKRYPLELCAFRLLALREAFSFGCFALYHLLQ